MFILADTSIWIDHLRKKNSLFSDLLEAGSILMHPCVRGELSLGSMKNRAEILRSLDALPEAEIATEDEVRQVIEIKKLWAQGIGWVDTHLLASALLTASCALWTFDNYLREAATKAGAKLFHGPV
jgi:predicted nucleic acid-binding protein